MAGRVWLRLEGGRELSWNQNYSLVLDFSAATVEKQYFPLVEDTQYGHTAGREDGLGMNFCMFEDIEPYLMMARGKVKVYEGVSHEEDPR